MELAEWSRFDPRLLEQLIVHLRESWKELSPVRLNSAASASTWPAVLGVLLEQTRLSLGKAGKEPMFRGWMDCATANLPVGDGGLFFIGIAGFAGKMARRESSSAANPYLRWGYLWGELQLRAGSENSRALPRPSRENIARELAQRRERFSIRDYVDACGGHIGRRQAERDLRSFRFLRASGATKARVYSRGRKQRA